MSLPTTYPLGYEALGTIVTLDPGQTQAITAAYTQVTGLAATSTAAYAAVAGSQLQTSFNEVVSYYVSVVTHGVTCQIYGSVDGVNFVAIAATITAIAAAASALVSLADGGWLFYKLYIIDTVGGTHGVISGAGFCI